MPRCVDVLLNIANTYFDGMVNHIYPSEHQLNKADFSNTESLGFKFISQYHMELCHLRFLD